MLLVPNSSVILADRVQSDFGLFVIILAIVQLSRVISVLQIAGTTCLLDQALNSGFIKPRTSQVKYDSGKYQLKAKKAASLAAFT